MKTSSFLRTLAFSAMIIIGLGLSAQNPQYEGVGPVVCGSVQKSQLPEKAQKFVAKHFKNAEIASVQKEFSDGDYDVVLSDGTQVDFTAKGEFKDVEAAKGKSLDVAVVKSIVPGKTFKELTKRELTNKVESIEKTRKGYSIDFNHKKIDSINFDNEGVLIVVEYED